MTLNVFSDCSEVDHVEGLLHELAEELLASESIVDKGVILALRQQTAEALEANGLIVTEVDKRLLDPSENGGAPFRTGESVAARQARIREKAVNEYARHIGLPKGAKPPKLPAYIEQIIARHQVLSNQLNSLEEALIGLRAEVLRCLTAGDLQDGGLLLLSNAMWRLAANERKRLAKSSPQFPLDRGR